MHCQIYALRDLKGALPAERLSQESTDFAIAFGGGLDNHGLFPNLQRMLDPPTSEEEVDCYYRQHDSERVQHSPMSCSRS